MNPDRPLMPASTVKLFTTGFARTVLGGTARRATRVVGEGTLDSTTGAWVGSWALQLNGDPSLERAEGSGPTLYDLAVELQNHGIRKLTGPLQVQSLEGPADAVYPAAWSSRHQGRIFAPPVGPLTVHENVVWVTVQPGTRSGQRVRIIETAPEGISSMVTVTAATRSGRRSRLALHPRQRGRMDLERNHRRPGRCATADGSGARPAGRACSRMEQGAGSDGYYLESVLLHGPASGRWPPGIGGSGLPAARLAGE